MKPELGEEGHQGGLHKGQISVLAIHSRGLVGPTVRGRQHVDTMRNYLSSMSPKAEKPMNWGPAGKAGKSPSMSNMVDVSALGGVSPSCIFTWGPWSPGGPKVPHLGI